MTEARIIIGLASLLVAAAAIVWGLVVFLGIRAHRNRMDDLEGKWK